MQITTSFFTDPDLSTTYSKSIAFSDLFSGGVSEGDLGGVLGPRRAIFFWQSVDRRDPKFPDQGYNFGVVPE